MDKHRNMIRCRGDGMMTEDFHREACDCPGGRFGGVPESTGLSWG